MKVNNLKNGYYSITGITFNEMRVLEHLINKELNNGEK